MEKRYMPSIGVFAEFEFDEKLASGYGFTYLSMRKIAATIAEVASSQLENSENQRIDFELVRSKDRQEIIRANREISIKHKTVLRILRNNFFGLLRNSTTRDEDLLIFDNLPFLKKIAREVVNPLLRNGGIAICGNVAMLDIPSGYVEIEENSLVGITMAFEKALSWSRRAKRIGEYQREHGLSRKDFRWPTNNLLVPIRHFYQQEILAETEKLSLVSEFDLSIQLLMHLGAREPGEIWLGPGVPNDELILRECARLGKNLQEYFDSLYVEVDDRKIFLPARELNDARRSPFGAASDRAEIDLGTKKYVDKNGTLVLEANEKWSGKKVYFAPIQREISALYSMGFCNLHYANSGEIAAYGAFVEGRDMPFAYSSYGKVNYKYTNEMLIYLGFRPEDIIESSRAWSAPWAPENTMSVLFAYAHARLKEQFEELGGVITSINPNLGFSASAFKGIHFEIVSVKPTVFSYQFCGGTPVFLPKYKIAENLGVEISELKDSPDYGENKIPFLPTIELLYLFEKEARKRLLTLPIYRVSDQDYLYNR